jgi:hypothetical protein
MRSYRGASETSIWVFEGRNRATDQKEGYGQGEETVEVIHDSSEAMMAITREGTKAPASFDADCSMGDHWSVSEVLRAR